MRRPGRSTKHHGDRESATSWPKNSLEESGGVKGGHICVKGDNVIRKSGGCRRQVKSAWARGLCERGRQF